MRRNIKYSIYAGALTLGVGTILWLSNLNDGRKAVESLRGSDISSGEISVLRPTEDPKLKEKALKKAKERQEKLEKIKSSFEKFNPNVSQETVELFLNVCEHYGLDTNESVFNTCIAQICIESGAKHLDSNGKPLKSSGNAVGIGQIVPTTAFHFLKKDIPANSPVSFEKNVTDFYFAQRYDYFKTTDEKGNEDFYIGGKGRVLIKNWLANKKNNLYLWGYIMSKYLEENGRHASLLAYNRGVQFLAEYGDPSTHEYIRKVESVRFHYIEEELISQNS